MKKFIKNYLLKLKNVKWWKYLLFFLHEMFIFACILAIGSEDFQNNMFSYIFELHGYEFNLGVMFFCAIYTIGIFMLVYIFIYFPFKLILDSMLKDLKNAKREEDSKKD